MKIAVLTCIVSPHQLPLAREIVKLIGAENCCYAYTQDRDVAREKMGWGDGAPLAWCHPARECRDTLLAADLLYCGERDLDLMEERLRNGKLTCYMSERWFKPISIKLPIPKLLTSHFSLLTSLALPGWVRLLVPSYFRMARRFVKMFESPSFRFLPMGKWAERDMRLICRLNKLLTCHFSLLTPAFIPWGYFVAPSSVDAESLPRQKRTNSDSAIKILWAGRMLRLKRVDTIIKAVTRANATARVNGEGEHMNRFSLTLVGDGPEKARLQHLAVTLQPFNSSNLAPVAFLPSVPIAEVRSLMRSHDIFVFASNAEEGWGAVVNEALEEGMRVLGTYEAGSSSYMLPETNLFHAGDWRRLAELLQGDIPSVPIGPWSAKAAAERLLEIYHKAIK